MDTKPNLSTEQIEEILRADADRICQAIRIHSPLERRNRLNLHLAYLRSDEEGDAVLLAGLPGLEEAELRLKDACAVARYNGSLLAPRLAALAVPAMSESDLERAVNLAGGIRGGCEEWPLEDLVLEVRRANDAQDTPHMYLYLRFLPARINQPLPAEAPLADLEARWALRALLSKAERLLKDPASESATLDDLVFSVACALHLAEGCWDCSECAEHQ